MIAMKFILLVSFICFIASCRTGSAPPSNKDKDVQDYVYVGLGIFAPKFEEGIPSFGGDQWRSPMEVLIDDKVKLKISRGGHSLYVNTPNEKTILEMRRLTKEGELIYIMVYKLNDKGQPLVFWKDVMGSGAKSSKYLLLSGKKIKDCE